MSRYQVIYQKPFHCAIACLAMIIYRHSGILIDQEEVGERLGVCVPVKHREMFAHALGTAHTPGSSEGISTLDSLEQIQSELERVCATVWIDRIDGDRSDFLEQISSAYDEGSDVWLERVLHTQSAHMPYIHDQLYDGPCKDSFCLIDPEPEVRNRISVSPEALRASVDGSYARVTGALVIRIGGATL